MSRVVTVRMHAARISARPRRETKRRKPSEATHFQPTQAACFRCSSTTARSHGGTASSRCRRCRSVRHRWVASVSSREGLESEGQSGGLTSTPNQMSERKALRQTSHVRTRVSRREKTERNTPREDRKEREPVSHRGASSNGEGDAEVGADHAVEDDGDRDDDIAEDDNSCGSERSEMECQLVLA